MLKVPKVGGLIAVRRDGYQYGGAILGSKSAQPIEITLLKSDEIEERRYNQQPIPIDAVLRKKLVTEIESLCLIDLEGAANQTEQQIATQLLSKLSPRKTVELLNAGKLQGNSAIVAKQWAIQAFAKTDVPTATAIADEESDPMFRSILFRFLATNIAFAAPRA